ncbi:hypothetical protein KM043_001781 [Ampulex compressa]|nr:hypothetical protein KM043_001781 [Ampulex compressa]
MANCPSRRNGRSPGIDRHRSAGAIHLPTILPRGQTVLRGVVERSPTRDVLTIDKAGRGRSACCRYRKANDGWIVEAEAASIGGDAIGEGGGWKKERTTPAADPRASDSSAVGFAIAQPLRMWSLADARNFSPTPAASDHVCTRSGNNAAQHFPRVAAIPHFFTTARGARGRLATGPGDEEAGEEGIARGWARRLARESEERSAGGSRGREDVGESSGSSLGHSASSFSAAITSARGLGGERRRAAASKWATSRRVQRRDALRSTQQVRGTRRARVHV